MKKSGIYRIINNANGRVYVGSAVNLERRRWDHFKSLKGGYHRNRFMQRAWDKYGEDQFSFEVIEYVDDKELLIEREQLHLDQLSFEVGDPNKCYNICSVAGSLLGTKRTAESRAKMSAAAMGRVISEEHRAKLSAIHKGRVKSAETRAKLSAARKGRKMSAEFCRKISEAKRGTVASEETRRKMSETKKGKSPTEAHKLALRESNRAFTQEQVDEMVRLRKQGKTYIEIAAVFNTTKDTARNWCMREGGKKFDRPLPEETRQEIFRRRHAGESLRAICAACKVAKITVNKVYEEELAKLQSQAVCSAYSNLTSTLV